MLQSVSKACPIANYSRAYIILFWDHKSWQRELSEWRSDPTLPVNPLYCFLFTGKAFWYAMNWNPERLLFLFVQDLEMLFSKRESTWCWKQYRTMLAVSRIMINPEFKSKSHYECIRMTLSCISLKPQIQCRHRGFGRRNLSVDNKTMADIVDIIIIVPILFIGTCKKLEFHPDIS